MTQDASKGPYVLLSDRRFGYERTDEAGDGRMIYFRAERFETYMRAQDEGFQRLPCTIYKHGRPTDEDRRLARAGEKPYLVVVEHYGKHKRTDYTGDTDYLTTYDAIRCSADEVEGTLERLAKEDGARHVSMGIELRVLDIATQNGAHIETGQVQGTEG